MATSLFGGGRVLNRAKVLSALEEQLAQRSGLVAELARELVGRLRVLTQRINALERQFAAITAQLAPSLITLPGCAALTAAKLLGEVAGVRRFKSRAAFAMHNGTAPIPVWSGRADRFRLNRGGIRQLNVALHRIAMTQMRLDGAGRSYIGKRVANGNTKTEAIRALRRRISDEVYRRLWQDENHSAACLEQAA
ncbi:MAG: transposase [Candidatus Dormibacteria bacterium]